MSDFPNERGVAAIMVLWREQRVRDYENMNFSLEDSIVCAKPHLDTLGELIKNLEGMRKKHV